MRLTFYIGHRRSPHRLATEEAYVAAHHAPFILSAHEQSSGEAVQAYGVSDMNQVLLVDVVYELRRVKCGSLVKSIVHTAIEIPVLVRDNDDMQYES